MRNLLSVLNPRVSHMSGPAEYLRQPRSATVGDNPAKDPAHWLRTN